MLRKSVMALIAVFMFAGIACAAGTAKNPVVQMETSQGTIKLELFEKEAPISVKNFLGYVNKGFYSGTIFHRVINGFMIQGGGFTTDFVQKPTVSPIRNEATNGLKNDRGTIAMARTGMPDSATAQFFINVVNNDMLNRPNPDGYGYAVFGKVIAGMDVVDKIKAVRTGFHHGMGDVPEQQVVIKSVKVLK
ncbi:peptidyl-prolyl cis-trans isomerase [Oryzomonas japonica]|uniref:Peptidyl-prolyl cis-trans isomerase n=1 Tax=Oryzomonas japonica TaxID=2603858 RepID=A0A7J4ZS36_9BACT|nr:peptidylprolyl isomerase [Oryzomonas japonica]KAB0666077.1 peptidyl-prolyl cis-trans isomerase [Oryzomonas japonica]